MILVMTVIVALLALIYFGVIRRMNEKWREVIHFLALYLWLIVIYLGLPYFIRKITFNPQHWNFNSFLDSMKFTLSVVALPSFIVSYLLYPFKTIKRSKILIGVLLFIMIITVGAITFIEIAHYFSNM
jgi:hypothetical protein